MSEENKNMNSQDTEVKKDENMNLSDERRVKVLSPGMMVFKRFIRNKLAITGLIILLVMFLFAFLCPIFSPYSQEQVFTHYEEIMKEYAGAMTNTDLRYAVKEGYTFNTAAQAQMALAISKKKETFKAGEQDYIIHSFGEDFYGIEASVQVVGAKILAKQVVIEDVSEGFEVTPEFEAALNTALTEGTETFIVGDVDYTITRNGKEYSILVSDQIAVASMLVFDAYNESEKTIVDSFEFRYLCEMALSNGEKSFEYDGVTYQFDDEFQTVYKVDGENLVEFAMLSDMLVSAYANDIFLDASFKDAVRDAIATNQTSFTLTDDAGTESIFRIDRVNQTYVIKTYTSSKLITRFSEPSADHLLGTDGNGMDVIVRLMYGGRISLMVGFVVVFIELFLGVIIGGVAGYFGRWVDNVLMRFIDLFNCIPFYPMVMIIGALMDKLQVDPMERIFLLMALLGILGWPGIARTVRGQILSLREQDFMVATEATGIRVSRRIFKHLVPNVMPLLIVYATMNLGGIIISEATLSFLGLGVKYPLASWGSIINAANDQFILTNYWFIWMPAGILIVLTVLGFNFVGDGLRDAFDPKMKR